METSELIAVAFGAFLIKFVYDLKQTEKRRNESVAARNKSKVVPRYAKHDLHGKLATSAPTNKVEAISVDGRVSMNTHLANGIIVRAE